MKRAFKKIIIPIFQAFGYFLSLVISYKALFYLKLTVKIIYTAWLSRNFKVLGKNSIIGLNLSLINGKFISVGNNTYIGSRVVLNAWTKYGDSVFSPEIIIGNNVSIGDDSHITAINSIKIGNNVLTGKKITITDNAHGINDIDELDIPPLNRKVYSKGKVVIEDNVWIGDKVTILPGVHIGHGSVIGANSVVTKNIPPYCIAAGIPAKKLR